MSWKRSNIKVIYKKGSKYDVNNYRGVSMTSLMGKTLERIIVAGVLEHCQNNNMISRSQHGGLRRKSTVSNLLGFIDNIVLKMDRGETIGSLYTDHSKYFDTVPHAPLLEVLRCRYGFNGKIMN